MATALCQLRALAAFRARNRSYHRRWMRRHRHYHRDWMRARRAAREILGVRVAWNYLRVLA